MISLQFVSLGLEQIKLNCSLETFPGWEGIFHAVERNFVLVKSTAPQMKQLFLQLQCFEFH
jgi:hypothetical protein